MFQNSVRLLAENMKMDVNIIKQLWRGKNVLPSKALLKNLLFYERLAHETIPNFSSQQCIKVSRINCFLPARAYKTSSIMRQEEEKKLKRPDAMGGGSRKHFNEQPIGGQVTWTNLAVCSGIMAVLLGVYYKAKADKDALRDAERKKEIGKSKIGGTFNLIDQDGNPKTSEDYYGKWLLLYFGFTHCPDICPDEMEKMADVYDKLKESRAKNPQIVGEVVPLMITVDPERDGVPQMKEYCKEFHPELVGLTGSKEKITEACKAFRVYFSAGPRDDEDDYIVDHTIIIYLIDPEGGFVDYYGQTKTASQIATSVKIQMGKYQASVQKSLYDSIKSAVSS